MWAFTSDMNLFFAFCSPGSTHFASRMKASSTGYNHKMFSHVRMELPLSVLTKTMGSKGVLLKTKHSDS